MSNFTSTNSFSVSTPASANARAPRAIVQINGISIKYMQIVVITTTFYVADQFQLDIPLNGQDKSIDLNFWASSQVFDVKIYIGFPPDPNSYSTQDLELFIQGMTTEVEIDPLSGHVVLYGRDLTGSMIDTKLTQKFSEQTSSQIATQFAQQNDLTPQVTATTDKVGTFFNNQSTLLSYQNSQWDLLVFLAQQENFVAFVTGTSLVFEPRQTSEKTQANNVYTLTYQAPTSDNSSPIFTGSNLRFVRATSLASDVSVTVRVPYATSTGRAYSATASATHKQRTYLKNVKNPTTPQKQKYVFVMPGLSSQQAQTKAQQLLTDLSMHEIRIEATVPGDNILKKDSLIKVVGTNTSFDQIYYPDNVVRRIDNFSGYTMDISAKNISQDVENMGASVSG